jgi:two-component system, OmpR family, sensor histidine kinase AdeS
MRLLPKTLRWQIALAMGLSAACATIVVLGGMIGFLYLYENYHLNQLVPDMRTAIEAWNANQRLSNEQMELVRQYYSLESTSYADLIPLASFCILGVLLGTAAGVALGKWLARPIERVAEAAQLIAAGDIETRVPAQKSRRGEIRQLVDNFNTLAESLNEAERELAASSSAIAHELRTPVTILKARLQAVKDGVLPLEGHELDAWIAQVDTLTAIIDDLHDLSFAGSKELSLNLKTVDLAEEAELGLRANELAFSTSGMKIETDLKTAKASLDAKRVRQVLNALFSNARRYAAAGGVVRVETGFDSGNASLRVLDRGPGLPIDSTSLIFDRFWRGESSRARDTGGAGLGLSVVRLIAEAHGGTASARQREGGGAVFEVKFPWAAGMARDRWS